MGVLVGGMLVAIGLWCASPAVAAFPGANGLLAVQPVSGGGILLVAANGRLVRRICMARGRCGTPRRPRWSPDGRAIVFAGPAIRIVYTDGSCMNCEFGAAPDPAFRPDGTAISFIQRRRLRLDGIDGLRERNPGIDGVTDAVWSASGRVAVVRGGALWIGRPGHLARIGSGDEPSWSPSGDAVAAVRSDRVVIIRLRDHRVRYLARGSAPAYSPDGRLIAFVAPDGRLMIIRTRRGRARAVGDIRGVSVDWQPRPRGPNPGCAAPPGSTVMASTPDAIVTQDGTPPSVLGFQVFPPIAYMGCLRADGRERLLERFLANNYDGASWVRSAVLAAPYAALLAHSDDSHYGGSDDRVQVFDLRTGVLRRGLGGEFAGCPSASPDPTHPMCASLAEVLVGSDGVSAARSWAVASPGNLSNPVTGVACPPTGTLCVAVDGVGGLFTSGDPAAGRSSWSSGTVGAPAFGPDTVACPSESLCVGTKLGNIYTSTDPAGGAPTWTSFGTGSTANDVSCPTALLCVVTRGDGSILTSTDPAAGAQTWTAASIDPLQSVNATACSTEPRCFVADSAGKVLTSSDPTGGPSAWSTSPTTPRFWSGSCASVSLCVTVDGQEIATTTDADAADWTTQPTADDLLSVSCASASLCVAVGEDGALEVSTDPASGIWTSTTIDSGFSLTSISCSSPSLCVAADANGHVVVSTNPAGGSSAWAPALVDGDPCDDTTPCSIESIQTADRGGVRTVDTSELSGSGPFLTGLALSGDTLSWSHDGSPRSVALTPP